MRTQLMAACITLFAAGCSTTTMLNSRDTSTSEVLKKELSGKTVTVELLDGSKFDEALVLFNDDSVTVSSVGSGASQTFHLTELKTISNFSRARGLTRGLGYGALGGAGVGLAAGFLSGNDSPGIFSFNKEQKMLYNSIGLGVVGGVGGMIVGIAAGSNDQYNLISDTTSALTKAPATARER